ncbi:MAG: metalloregulator ArsR/SmtB family transcription factor [Alphaproteobacteria bacterium]|nr:metalloregulator ArsR/SmtB family transcription factor [Alphaproteobacteria bacterium]
MKHLLSGLRAAAEPTRLRLLALAARAELAVTELAQIVGQSQPRVSRHLKLLVEGGLLERHKEGAWAFYRLADTGPGAELARGIVAQIPPADLLLGRDLERLAGVRRARNAAASEYFRANAHRWNRLRSLHVAEVAVEKALVALLPGRQLGDLIDIGTGTGRILELLAPRLRSGVGVDVSRDMLAVARAQLELAGIDKCRTRLGDMYALPFPPASFDVATIHQVLHYADDPAAAIAEAARVLKPEGRLAVVDFAPHDLEDLRRDHQHRRLGFADAEVEGWFRAAGLRPARQRRLAGDPLTVAIWTATRVSS